VDAERTERHQRLQHRTQGVVMDCQWPGCNGSATHRITARFPEGSSQVREVCRAHDVPSRTEIHRARPSRPSDPPLGGDVTVHCPVCDLPWNVPDALADDGNRSCPVCGSEGLVDELNPSASLGFHSTLTMVVRRHGTHKPALKKKVEDSFTRDLGGWGRIDEVKDVEHHKYWKLIVLWDGTEIEIASRLEDHLNG